MQLLPNHPREDNSSERTIEQGIIVFTGTETFAKEPQLVKLFRARKLTLVWCYEKMSTGFSRMSVTLNLLHFDVLLWCNM